MTFESKLQPGIHLVGDAIIGGDMPKSAFSANSQAKACAFAIAAALTGSPRFPPHLFNTCYTYLAPDDAFSNAISFKPDAEAGKLKTVNSFVSKVGESAEIRRKTARAGGRLVRRLHARHVRLKATLSSARSAGRRSVGTPTPRRALSGSAPIGCSGVGAGTGSGSRSSRSEFTTTRMLEPAMTAAARIGCRSPSAASVSATRL